MVGPVDRNSAEKALVAAWICSINVIKISVSAGLLPLPYHAKNQYTTAPGRLEDEVPYRHHHGDWETFQTRYVTPDVFKNALRDEPGK